MASASPDITAEQDYSQSMRILALISTGHALSNFYVLCLPALLPFFRKEFAVSFTALGVILTTRAVTTGVLQVPVGFLVDKFGGKKVLIVGLFILSASFSLLAVIPDFFWSVPLMVLFGMGLASMRPCNYTILNASIHPSFVGRAFGINMFTAHAARAVAPPLIVSIAVVWDWRIAVLIAGGLGFLVTVGLTTQWRIVRDDSVVPKKTHDLSFFQEIRHLASASLLMFFVFFIFNALTTHGVHSFTVAALVEVHNTPLTVASGVLTAFLVTGALGVLLGGFIVDKIPRHAMIAIVTLVGSGAMFVLVGALPMPVVAIIILMSLAGVLQGILRPARDMLMRAVIPRESFGKAIGIVATGAAVGGATAPVIFGWILDYGDPSWLFYVLAANLGILVLCVLVPKKPISLS
jgi:FSR family fosmidomycin resistance protein-like MFS transporter